MKYINWRLNLKLFNSEYGIFRFIHLNLEILNYNNKLKRMKTIIIMKNERINNEKRSWINRFTALFTN